MTTRRLSPAPFACAAALFCLAAHATALTGPSCEATAKVGTVSTKDKTSQLDITISALKPLVNDKGKACEFLAVGQTLTLEANQPQHGLQTGEVIHAGVERATSLGPEGAVGWLMWRPVRVEAHGGKPERTLPSTTEFSNTLTSPTTKK